jgi:hypothetical protein
MNSANQRRISPYELGVAGLLGAAGSSNPATMVLVLLIVGIGMVESEFQRRAQSG